MATVIRTIRHPDYVQEHHDEYLQKTLENRIAALETNPYAGYTFNCIDADFFGAGYLITSYTSLAAMFGKFMAGFDIEDVWEKSALDILSPQEIHKHAAEQKQKLDANIDMNIRPAFQRALRDINAVGSSSFVIGCANIESKRIKDYAKISLDATTSLLIKVQDKFRENLAWNRDVITSYAKIMKAYFSFRMDTDIKGYTFLAEDVLWPFTVLDFDRRALNALGPQYLENETDQVDGWYQRNKTLIGAISILAWTIQGAYIGSSYPPWGTLIGAVVGFVIGVALYFMQ